MLKPASSENPLATRKTASLLQVRGHFGQKGEDVAVATADAVFAGKLGNCDPSREGRVVHRQRLHLHRGRAAVWVRERAVHLVFTMRPYELC